MVGRSISGTTGTTGPAASGLNEYQGLRNAGWAMLFEGPSNDAVGKDWPRCYGESFELTGRFQNGSRSRE